MDAYAKNIEIVKEKSEYNIILLDRTVSWTKIFIEVNINNPLQLNYLSKKLKKVEK
ncbi:9701_t:CDS:1, partial [Dentiscutata erythropus]